MAMIASSARSAGGLDFLSTLFAAAETESLVVAPLAAVLGLVAVRARKFGARIQSSDAGASKIDRIRSRFSSRRGDPASEHNDLVQFSLVRSTGVKKVWCSMSMS